MSFNWKDLIGAVAPTIATALGGPLAGAATSAISQAVFGKPDASEDELNKALSKATPEMIAAIKKGEQDFQVKMKELDINIVDLRYKDIASARNREIQTKDKVPQILAAFAVVCFVGIIACILFGYQPKDAMRDGFWMLVGAAIAVYKDVYGYYFGSSSGSDKKNDTINNMLK